jgi:hypothetical protein
MLVKPDAQQLNALARLVQSPDGEVLLKILDTELERLTTNLLDSSGEITLRVQGMAREIKELITLLRQSPHLVKKP